MENAGDQAYDVVAIGYQAARNAQRSRSVYVGSYASENADAGSYYATSVGYEANRFSGSYYTTYLGFYAGRSSGGPQNVGIGSESLMSCNGFNNTAVGHMAAQSVNANSGVFIGYNSGAGNDTAAGNTIIGANVTGSSDISNSVMIGSGDGEKHLSSISTTDNTYLGYSAGKSATGTGNTFVGAGLSGATGTNQLRISSGSGTQIYANGAVSTSVFNPFILKKDTTAGITGTASPVAGMMMYDTTQNVLAFYNGSAWRKLNDSPI